jgi:hypothetical protein
MQLMRCEIWAEQLPCDRYCSPNFHLSPHLRIYAILITIVFQKDSTANGNGHARLFKFPKVRNFSDLERLPNHLETSVTLLPISQLTLQKMQPLVTKKSTMQQRFPTNIPRSRLVISNTTQKYGLALGMTIILLSGVPMNGTVQHNTSQSSAKLKHVGNHTSTFPLRLNDVKHTENLTFSARHNEMNIIYILRYTLLRESRHVCKFGTSTKALERYTHPIITSVKYGNLSDRSSAPPYGTR